MQQGDIQVEGRIERKKKETRNKIVNVAMDLFRRQGFVSTTMEQIAVMADIARKTLYNHFPVKEAIVDEYVKGISKEQAMQTLENLQSLPDTRSRLLSALDRAYQWVEMNPELTAICLRYRLKNMCPGPEVESEETGTQSTVAEIIRLGQRSGEIRPDIPIRLLVRQIDLLRSTVVLDWLNDTSKFELRQEMAKIVDLFLFGAAARKDSQK